MEQRQNKDHKKEREKMRAATGFGTATGCRRRLLDACGGGQGKARRGSLAAGSGVAPPVACVGDAEGYRQSSTSHPASLSTPPRE